MAAEHGPDDLHRRADDPELTHVAVHLNVTSTSQFPSSGEATVAMGGGGSATVAYTGIVGNSLTGCTFQAGTPGAVAAGSLVTLLDVGWSFELMVPINRPGWQRLEARCRATSGCTSICSASARPPGRHAVSPGFFAAQCRFPLPNAGRQTST